MTQETTSLETLDGLVAKLKDIHNSYLALIDKVVQFKTEAESAALNTFSDELDKSFETASDNAVSIEQLLKDLEMERNRVKQGA